MRHLSITIALLLSLAAGPSIARAQPTTMRLSANVERCTAPAKSALARLGLGRVTLFTETERGEGPLCFAAALDLAARALLLATTDDSPTDVAGHRKHPSRCDARCWLNRPTAAIAGPTLTEEVWPQPPDGSDVANAWLFFATSPDLSSHWWWIAVDERPLRDGTYRVRLWSQR